MLSHRNKRVFLLSSLLVAQVSCDTAYVPYFRSLILSFIYQYDGCKNLKELIHCKLDNDSRDLHLYRENLYIIFQVLLFRFSGIF